MANLLESLMVVAYVDSVMRRSGRHLSIQADLVQHPPHITVSLAPVSTYPKCLSGVML